MYCHFTQQVGTLGTVLIFGPAVNVVCDRPELLKCTWNNVIYYYTCSTPLLIQICLHEGTKRYCMYEKLYTILCNALCICLCFVLQCTSAARSVTLAGTATIRGGVGAGKRECVTLKSSVLGRLGASGSSTKVGKFINGNCTHKPSCCLCILQVLLTSLADTHFDTSPGLPTDLYYVY